MRIIQVRIARASEIIALVVLLVFASRVLAQVSIKERVTIDPLRGGTRRVLSTGIGSYAPCDPYFPPLFVPPSTYQQVLFAHGDWSNLYLPDNSSWWWLTGVDGSQYASIWYQNGLISAPFHFYVMPIPVVHPDGATPESTAVMSVSLLSEPYNNAYTILYYIVKAKYCLSSWPSPRQISFRDSVDISGYVGNQCGTVTAPQAPDTMSYTVSIYQGMNYGTLKEPGTGRTGKTLTGLRRQGTGFALIFLENCDNPDYSAKVRFRYTASDPTIEAHYDSMTVNAGPSGPVVKYRITLSPDSLLHGDTTVVTVAAVDSNNQLQLWPDTTHLTFALDSTRFARFISPAGDSVQSPLTRVLYSDAKVGRVKVVVDGTKPALPGPKGIQLSVTDGTKNGQKTVYARPLKFTVQTARNTIRPLRDLVSCLRDSLTKSFDFCQD